MDLNEKNEQYYFCLFHIFCGKHINFHHVVLKTHDLEKFRYLDAGPYQYFLISSHLIPLTDKDKEVLILKGLLMDGESLEKRFNKAERQK